MCVKVKKSSTNGFQTWLRTSIVVLVAVIAGFLHPYYVAELHERSLTFSMLSEFERELTFQSELAFYYSFYKQIIQTDNLSSAWNSLIYDSRTEHCPRDHRTTLQDDEEKRLQCFPLNAIQRFNIYPELVLAIVYRFLHSRGWLPVTCYEVDRAVNGSQILAYTASSDMVTRALTIPRNSPDALPMRLTANPLQFTNPYVVSCVGTGEAIRFYTLCVFALSSLTLVGLAWSGWLVASAGGRAGSTDGGGFWLPVWGAVLPTAAFFFHHREATRVQWTPALRESFAYPFFFLQHAYLLRSLAVDSSPSGLLLHCCLLLSFQLPWQFAQFALATQVAALFAATCLTLAAGAKQPWLLSPPPAAARQLLVRVEGIVLAHLLTHLLNYVLQFGNRLLLFSPYLAGLIGVLVSLKVLGRSRFTGQLTRASDPSGTDEQASGDELSPAYNLVRLAVLPSLLAVSMTMALVAVTSWLAPTGVHDGGHIVDLLRHKLSAGGRFRNYHTKLYTCAQEFDFMPLETLLLLTTTGLIPGAVLACLGFVLPQLANRSLFWRSQAKKSRDSTPILRQSDWLLAHTVSLFVVIQLGFFTLMAVMIMRLKLFWTPYLCLSLALLAQPFWWSSLTGRLLSRPAPSGQPAKPSAGTRSPSRLLWHALLALLLAHMAFHGRGAVERELAISGNFMDLDNEALVTWFRSLHSPGDSARPLVIAGNLPLMGQLRLLLLPFPSSGQTGFAFTNHPHYEDAVLRYRTVLADSVYSFKSIAHVWHIYRHVLDADFVVVNEYECRPDERGCSRTELFRLTESASGPVGGHQPLCQALFPSTHRANRPLSPIVTPSELAPYFSVVYVDGFRGLRLVLLVRP